jgi:hypothetical protein
MYKNILIDLLTMFCIYVYVERSSYHFIIKNYRNILNENRKLDSIVNRYEIEIHKLHNLIINKDNEILKIKQEIIDNNYLLNE